MRSLAAVSFSGELRWLAVWLQDAIQALAQRNDLIGKAGKPGLHPHRTFEKGLRRLIWVANANTHDQPAGVDETYLVEQSSRRGEAGRDRT
jgi:hypothetical protein